MRHSFTLLFALAVLIGLTPGSARAHYGYGCFGFFDYRRSCDPEENPEYRHHRACVEKRLHRAFHHMSPQEAHRIWYRDGCKGRWRHGTRPDCGHSARTETSETRPAPESAPAPERAPAPAKRERRQRY